jgi:biopolymer transport protein ExbD
MANKNIKKEWGEQEVDFKPFMNLMVVLIPMLLLSAEFAKIAVIDINLPEGRGSQTTSKVQNREQEEESNKLLLTAIITDSVVTLGAKGGFLPSVFYQEFHHYIALNDPSVDFTVPYNPLQPEPPMNPKTGTRMTINEKYDIFLYATDEQFSGIKKCIYTEYGEMCVDENNEPIVLPVSPGQQVFAVPAVNVVVNAEGTIIRKPITVTDPSKFELKQMSVYDELKNRLITIKEKFKDADDADAIIIAAENEVLYDKIIQIMDAAKIAGFPKISIAKLRS